MWLSCGLSKGTFLWWISSTWIPIVVLCASLDVTDVLVVFTGPVSCKTSSVTTRFVFLLTVCGTFPAQLGIENFGRIYVLVLRAPGCEMVAVNDPFMFLDDLVLPTRVRQCSTGDSTAPSRCLKMMAISPLLLKQEPWMTGVAVYEKPKFPMGATSVFFAKKALSAVSLRGGNFSSNSRLELLTLAGFAVTVALVYGYMFSSST